MPYLKHLLILFTFICLNASAQNRTLDSLLHIFPKQKEDTTKALLCESIAKQYTFISDPETSLSYAQKGVSISKKLKYDNGLYLNHFVLAKAYIMLSDYQKALAHLDTIARNEKACGTKLYTAALSAM